MIHITPINDLKEHIECTTCNCNPNVIFENEEIIVIHNSYDSREWKEGLNKKQLNLLNVPITQYSNEQMFLDALNNNELTLEDLKEMLVIAEKEEEFEICESLKKVIYKIKL